jgi:hypothetical protein
MRGAQKAQPFRHPLDGTVRRRPRETQLRVSKPGTEQAQCAEHHLDRPFPLLLEYQAGLELRYRLRTRQPIPQAWWNSDPLPGTG